MLVVGLCCYWPGLLAKALEGVNVKDLLSNVRSGVGAAAPAASAATEEKKEEPEEESDDYMGFGLFD